MKFLIITIASLAFANAGHLQTYNLHDSHDLLSTNSISSYSSHQAFPGALTYQSHETIGLPLPSYTPRFSAIPAQANLAYPISYVPRQHLTYNPQFAAYPIHNQPALISQAPAFIQQYPSFIQQQQPSFINQIPSNPALFPQNPIPSEPQQVSNIPQGAEVDADTVSVEASRASNEVRNQQVNNDDDDDSVTIEAAGRSLPEFKTSNNTTQAIFSSTENSASTSSTTSTTESSVQARNSQQQSIEERLQYLNEARKSLASNGGANVISRSFFGNPSVFARFNLQ